MTVGDATAEDYVEHLAHLVADLPAGDRADLLEGIAEHLADAAARGDLPTTLARLGSPEEVARAAHAEVPLRGSGRWLVWTGAGLTAATIAGFAVLGALTAATALFDDDADWSIHPAVVLFGTGFGIVAGVLGTVAARASRAVRLREQMWLAGLWVLALALSVVGYEIALASPPGAGFAIGGLEILLGGTGALATIAIGVCAARRIRGR